jgi:two-component system, NtrC family, sensor kinase
MRRVFEPFFTTRLGKGGSGLGMSIARNLAVQVLGGRLEVESEPDLGTRFILSMPSVLKDGAGS